MALPRARMLDLLKLQCNIFGSTFNPEGQRLGTKILRQRLRGPTFAAYYPRKVVTMRDMMKEFPEFRTWDESEQYRFESIQITRSRGKGPPKKKRTKEESRKFGKKK